MLIILGINFLHCHVCTFDGLSGLVACAGVVGWGLGLRLALRHYLRSRLTLLWLSLHLLRWRLDFTTSWVQRRRPLGRLCTLLRQQRALFFHHIGSDWDSRHGLNSRGGGGLSGRCSCDGGWRLDGWCGCIFWTGTEGRWSVICGWRIWYACRCRSFT